MHIRPKVFLLDSIPLLWLELFARAELRMNYLQSLAATNHFTIDLVLLIIIMMATNNNQGALAPNASRKSVVSSTNPLRT